MVDRQSASNEIWRLALDVRAAWDRYFSILIAIEEHGPAPRVIQALTQARRDIEHAERRLFSQADLAIVPAKD